MSRWNKTPPNEPGWYWTFGGDTLAKAANLKERPTIVYVGVKGIPAIKWWGPKIREPETPIEPFIAPETEYECEPREGSNIGDTYELHGHGEFVYQGTEDVVCAYCDESMELLVPDDLPYRLCIAKLAEAAGVDY